MRVPGAYASAFRNPGDAGGYASMTLALSAGAACAALLPLALLGLPLAAAGVVFALLPSVLLPLPVIEKRRLEGEIEASMPFFLRELGMLLCMGLPFERAVRMASGDGGALGRAMENVAGDVSGGMSVQRALSRLAADYPSIQIKKAVAQMMAAYESGNAAEMGRIGDELLSQERHRLREYASKSALFGLLFLMSFAILPTFYLVYEIAGEAGLRGTGGAEMNPALLMLVVFPAAGALMLMLSSAMLPPSGFGGQGGGKRMLYAAAALSAATLAFPGAWPALAAAAMLAFAYMAFRPLGAEGMLEAIDGRLPDALLCAGGMPRSSPLERIFGMVEEGGFGPLSEEAARARRQLEAGLGAAAALGDLAQRCPTPMVRRAARMLSNMADTASFDRMGALAGDMLAFQRAMRERSGALAMQRYTLILGALLIPAILGTALSLAGSMAQAAGGGAGGQAAPIGAAALVPPYLAIYSIMSAGAIADAEGRESSGPRYALALCALSLLAFKFIAN